MVDAGVGGQIKLLQNLLANIATVASGVDSPVDYQLTMHLRGDIGLHAEQKCLSAVSQHKFVFSLQ